MNWQRLLTARNLLNFPSMMHRPPRILALLGIVTLQTLHGQPTAPTQERIAELRAMLATPHRMAASTTPLTLDVSSREEVRQFYRSVYNASEGVPMAWTGNYTSGSAVTAAGDISAAYKEAVRLRINFFRALAGVPAAITLSPTFNTKNQLSALMMSANNALQHTGIPTSWIYYTAAGAEAAASSNLAVGEAGPDAVTGYIGDGGVTNAAVGHRRWLFHPQTQEMGTGDVAGNGSLSRANTIWVFDGRSGDPRPPTRSTYIAYPPAGYVPYQLVWPRWSFSYPSADFSSATVTMTRNGGSVPVVIESTASGAGENTVVWLYDGLSGATMPTHAKPTSDTTYAVSVNGVRIGGVSQNFSYNVHVFDPDIAGADYAAMTVNIASTLNTGTAAPYTATLPAFATQYQFRPLQFTTYSKVYDAESGLDGITAQINGSYSTVATNVFGAGTASYRFAKPDVSVLSDTLTLPETFYATSSSASLTFLSRLGWATNLQTARVQLALDDGNAWFDVRTQSGNSTSGETSFSTRTVSLSAYAGRTFRLRFAYTYAGSGSYFPQTSAGVGWYLDNITLTGVQSCTAGTSATGTRGTGGSYTPSAAGTVGLQVRGMFAGTYPTEWGPVTAVTVSTASSYLANLSVRAAMAAGQTIIVGFVVDGGAKPILVRAAGPELNKFGLTGVVDPQLTLYTGAGAVVATNDNWDVALAPTFATLGAFAFDTGSKDAALQQSINGPHTAQAVATGAGAILVEAYDAGPNDGRKLVNLSARIQVGTGDNILIAGFVVSGTGTKQLLVRAVGPTLAGFGVPGTLADPQLSVFDGSTSIASNDDWSASLSSTFATVGAFALNAGSKDAAIVVTLQAGKGYTVQVSGVGNTTGEALVEIYAIP